MTELDVKLASVLADRFAVNSSRVHELAASLTNEQFWEKPFPYGNSFGPLVLHLTGNLNYYIGSQIDKTGYVRDRPLEFADPNPPTKEEALHRLDAAIAMVIATIREQSPEDWSRAYCGFGTNCGNRLDMVLQCTRSHAAPHWPDDLPVI